MPGPTWVLFRCVRSRSSRVAVQESGRLVRHPLIYLFIPYLQVFYKLPEKDSNLRLLIQRQANSYSFPHGAPDYFDHLFDHLSMSVYAVPQGSKDLPKSGNRLYTGVHGGPWGTTGTHMS
jgi:hypothetical protein